MAYVNPSQFAIERYALALRADRYKVQLKNSQTDEGYWQEYTDEQLLRSTGFLRKKNADGFDVYARPVGWQYVLLDDLTLDALIQIKNDDLRPCMLIETSPSNYQSWIILDQTPADRAEAKAICRSLAERYGADPGSAEPDHVGRLPGLTNRKPKHRQANGYFPFVRLCGSEHRLSTFSTLFGGGVLNNNLPVVSESASLRHGDQHQNNVPTGYSEQDFGIVVGLIRKGWDDERIEAHLLIHSPNILTRHGRYVGKYICRTIQNARRVA